MIGVGMGRPWRRRVRLPLPALFTRFVLLLCCAGLAFAGSIADTRLIDAVRNRDHHAIAALMDDVDVNAKQPDGATALAWAVHLQEHGTAELLLSVGADVNTSDDYGDTPLTLAAANADSDLIEKLLEAGADPHAARWNGETALMFAAGAGLADSVELLIAKGARLDATESRRGQTALMWAAAEGHTAVVELLIRKGADVNTTSQTGFTPLAFAVTRNDLESIANLIEAGPIPMRRRRMAVPVNMAAAYGHPDALRILLKAGAGFSKADKEGRTPLYSAAEAGDAESVAMLLAAGADPNWITASIEVSGPNKGMRRLDGEFTPLLAAAKGGHLKVMRQLAAAGANTKARTQDGATLLMQAARSARMPVIEYAYSLDDDVLAETATGRTVMHASITGTSYIATQDEICDNIRFLAERGADPDPQDKYGWTAISMADIYPVEKASMLMYELTIAAGRQAKIVPTDLR